MPEPRKIPRKRAYHHGDLASSLVEAAERLLERRGVAGLSLREAAKLAGVSHAAPYRHFRDKAALLEAVATAGFDRLAASMEEVRRRYPGDPEAQLRAAGHAYVLWATRNPERTHLMFGGLMKDPEISEALESAAERAFEGIRRIVDEGRQCGAFAGGSTESLVTTAWATVHGLTMLVLGSGKVTVADEDELDALTERICDTILDGIRARTPDA